jgi:hypothetical protein
MLSKMLKTPAKKPKCRELIVFLSEVEPLSGSLHVLLPLETVQTPRVSFLPNFCSTFFANFLPTSTKALSCTNVTGSTDAAIAIHVVLELFLAFRC